ncbi:MAG: D-alanyl-D-alanine endopeptidase [Pseudomonadota bacterium]|nr:D-alanyl-D-alanine endopeptidase [Pseudomonadota bacterium]
MLEKKTKKIYRWAHIPGGGAENDGKGRPARTRGEGERARQEGILNEEGPKSLRKHWIILACALFFLGTVGLPAVWGVTNVIEPAKTPAAGKTKKKTRHAKKARVAAAKSTKTRSAAKSRVRCGTKQAHKRSPAGKNKGRESGKLVLHSGFALVEDQRTGETLVQKNPQAVVPIASITKLMTAMVILDAQLDLNEPLVIQREDIDCLRHSRSRLPVGTSLTRQEALLLALMASENRAAHALGRTYPGGREAFVASMNAKARAIGLTATRFTEPTGLSEGNTSSAQDLARMVGAAYHYPLIREFTTCEEAFIQSGRRILAFHNTNRLVKSPRWQIGLSKTGFIDEAGRCLVMQAEVARRPVLIILLDAQGKMTRYGDANRIKQWMERSPSATRIVHEG